MELFQQLGELFLQAVPTVIIVFLFYLFMRWAFFTPMQRVLAEREKRTEGARHEAEAARAAAEEKARAYEEAMRKARAAVYATQDAERKALLEERAAKVREARRQANERTAAEKDRIAREAAAARLQIEAQTPQLASEIVRTIFEPRRAPQPQPSGGAR